MFDSNSRYATVPMADVDAPGGLTVRVVKLRRLPYPPGNPVPVMGSDRLDILAQREYRDGTKFWHIADANTELEANRLVQDEPSENPLLQVQTRVLVLPNDYQAAFMVKEFKLFYGGPPATKAQLDAIDEIVVGQEIGRVWQAQIKIPICIAEDGSWEGENAPA